MLNKDEAGRVVEELKEEDLPSILRDMYASNDRKGFAGNLLRPAIEEQVRNRKVILLPSGEDVIRKTGQIIEEIIPDPI